MTDTQLHQDFLQEFKQLLQKYDATYELEDFGTDYYSNRIGVISFNSQYDLKTDKVKRGFSRLELPESID